MSKSAEIKAKIAKSKSAYDGKRDVQVDGTKDPTLLSRRQIGAHYYQKKRRKRISKMNKRLSKKPVRMSETKAAMLLEKLKVSSRDLTLKIVTPLVEKQIQKVLRETVKKIHKRPYETMPSWFWDDMIGRLNQIKGLKDEDVVFKPADGDPRDAQFLSGMAVQEIPGWSKKARAESKAVQGRVFIEVNSGYSISQFLLDSTNGFKSQLNMITGLIRHELTHRIQNAPAYAGKLGDVAIIRKLRLFLNRKRGGWFVREPGADSWQKKYFALKAEKSAYANEIAHSIERQNTIWLQILAEYSYAARPKDKKQLFKQVYKLLKEAGYNDEEMLRLVKIAHKKPIFLEVLLKAA